MYFFVELTLCKYVDILCVSLDFFYSKRRLRLAYTMRGEPEKPNDNHSVSQAALEDLEEGELGPSPPGSAREVIMTSTPVPVVYSTDEEDTTSPFLSTGRHQGLQFGLGANKKRIQMQQESLRVEQHESPNTSIHLVYTPKQGSPATATSSSEPDPTAVHVITRTTAHYIIRKNRARSLSLDNEEQTGPANKKMCKRYRGGEVVCVCVYFLV